MSRIPKWKIEKTKVKVVFRLQFHATNVPQAGWDKLFLSFIPADTGKATAKTNKANVRNGSCKWSDPIYEATRLLQDSRTKKFEEKIYKLVVAMGSSRSSILGEVDINLTEFSEALKPSSVALPLRGCNFGTVLHVTVQLLTTKTGFREFEQQRETGARSPQMLANQMNHGPSETAGTSLDTSVDKVNARVRLKEDSLELPSVVEVAGPNEDYENSSHTSDGLYAEKNDISGAHEIGSFRSTQSGDVGVFPTSSRTTPEKEECRGNRLSTQGSNDWTHGWSSDYSADNDLAAAYEENTRLRVRLEVAESAFLQLKSEAKSLQRTTDELGAETQGVAQQLAVELASGQQLAREVSMLRTECSSLKRELEEIKSAKFLQNTDDGEVTLMTTPDSTNNSSKLGNDVLATESSIHDLQIKWLQSLLLLESKLHQTRNNVICRFQGSDFDFLLADLAVLQCIIENLKQGVHQGWSEEISIGENHYLERVFPCSGVSHQSNHESHKKNPGATSTLEEKVCELLQKLEESKTEKENLMEKMNQMEHYYEAFIHKLEESQKEALKELESLRDEHTSCFYTVSVLQAQKQKMQEEMDEQLMRLVEDRTTLESQNKELERRAIASETALKRVRWNYSVAVDRLQKDLELLSFQVLSMYESNETLAKQSLVDGYQIYPEEHSEEAGLCGNKELYHGQENPDVKQIRLGSMCASTESQLCSAENVALDNFSCKMYGQKYHLQAVKNEELLKRSSILTTLTDSQILSNAEAELKGSKLSVDMLKEACSTVEAELLEMYVANIEWKIFSDMLRESLHDARDGIKHMQDRICELEQQLHYSIDARESLVLKLNCALDQAKSSRESEARCILTYDDLTVKNQILEAKLQDISVENSLFMEKFAEYERLLEEFRAYESKYKACAEERSRFEDLLMQESMQKSQLKNEIGSVMEDFKALKEEFEQQSSSNHDLQKVLAYLQGRLCDLCSNVISSSKQINVAAFDDESLLQELKNMNYMAIMTSLELFQQQACQKILQLYEEKAEVEQIKDILQTESEKAESEILNMKQIFQSELDATTAKLNLATGLIEKLQQELQDMTEKFKLSSEAEEKLAVTNSDLSSRLALLEAELVQRISENRDLLQKLQESSAVVEELERTKVNLADREQENRLLMMSIQSKDQLSIQMEYEVSNLKDVLRFNDENLLREKGLREELEAEIMNLTLQLNEKDQNVLSFDEERGELVHLRGKVLDLEKANTAIQDALRRSKGSQKELDSKNLSLHFQLSNAENQLAQVLEDMLATEIEATCMRSQVSETAVQLNLFKKDLDELHRKHKEADSLLKARMSSEAELADRNAMLEAAVHSLKSDLEKVIHENEDLQEFVERNGTTLTEVDDIKSQDADLPTDNGKEIQKYEDEISYLGNMLTNLEEQMDSLRSINLESEIVNMILRSKLDEQQTGMWLLRETKCELTNLRKQHDELTQKLADQVLKTEEYKNLSIHLREQKEKAEADYQQAHGRRENEGSLFAMQESLRIAFIKEQYESKVQELRNQMFVSKKYAEEMLLKLQNALEEVETGKKTEIALAKRIEELSMRISDMEDELRTVSADRREMSNAYDSIKTELECTTLSFDCCKEEKLKVEASLQECNEERKRIRVELDLVKRLLENMVLNENTESRENHASGTPEVTSIGQLLGDANSCSALKETSNATVINSADDEGADILQSTSLSSNLPGEGEGLEHSNSGSKASETYNKESEKEASLGNHSTDNTKEHSREYKKLAIKMDLFQKQLERLKNENMSSVLPREVNLIDQSFCGLESALSQLDMANEHLGNISPSFKELPGSGNALERVLALELELAEALQEKKKRDFRFQSSFLKQHNDEVAVFQSFRDINELIQDMIDLKRRHVAVESELKEMQGRYSELSVQFAEVEGERQKLVMTLKNRSPRKS